MNTHNHSTLHARRSVNDNPFHSPITDHPSRRKAFTLIELLVVITIIAILAAILFPVFSQAKEAAKKTTCLSNCKQIATAFLMYATDYDDIMPATYSIPIAPNVYLDMNFLYSDIQDYNTPTVYTSFKGGLLDAYLKAFELTGCPSGRDFLNFNFAFSPLTRGLMSYGYNLNNLTGTSMSEIQEPSNTLIFADAAEYRTVLSGAPSDGVYTYYGLINDTRRGLFHGIHNRKSNVGWVDGHAKAAPVTYRDAECRSDYVALGIVKSKLDSKNIGWFCPPGLIAQNGTTLNWASSIANDTHWNNYYRLKKVP